MASLTSRLKLVLAADADNIDVDNFLDNNFQIIEQYLPNFVCTSTSRPTTVFAGMVIYETDTGYLRQWNGVRSIWEGLNFKSVLSGDARPSGALLGDKLFETDTGIMRRWDGTRFRPIGGGNIYYSEFTGNSTTYGAGGINPFGANPFGSITTDGVTPYNITCTIAGFFSSGAAPQADDSTLISILDNGVSIGQMPAVFGHTVQSRVSAIGTFTRRYTPTNGAHTFTVLAQRVNGGTLHALYAASAPASFKFVED